MFAADINNGSSSADVITEEESADALIQAIQAKKASEPSSMFVSGWEEDEQDIVDKDMNDPMEQFLTAAEDGDVEKLQLLYSEKPQLLIAQDRDKYTALHRAAYNDRTEVCKWLLAKGADPEIRTSDGWTALHCAACWGNFNVVAILLSHGVDVNSRTDGKIVPLHLAINTLSDDSNKQYMTVKYLLEAPGIEMNSINGAGDTPLTLARRAPPKILELLESHLR